MQEYASRLVGLYHCNGMPQVISIGFKERPGWTVRLVNFDTDDGLTKVNR